MPRNLLPNICSSSTQGEKGGGVVICCDWCARSALLVVVPFQLLFLPRMPRNFENRFHADRNQTGWKCAQVLWQWEILRSYKEWMGSRLPFCGTPAVDVSRTGHATRWGSPHRSRNYRLRLIKPSRQIMGVIFGCSQFFVHFLWDPVEICVLLKVCLFFRHDMILDNATDGWRNETRFFSLSRKTWPVEIECDANVGQLTCEVCKCQETAACLVMVDPDLDEKCAAMSSLLWFDGFELLFCSFNK